MSSVKAGCAERRSLLLFSEISREISTKNAVIFHFLDGGFITEL